MKRLPIALHVGVLFGLLCPPSPVSGQFTTVINVPPDAEVTSIGSNTQLNLFEGGELPRGFQVGSAFGTDTNVELNIFGGEVRPLLDAHGGSQVNLAGGVVQSFTAFADSEVNISGGEVLFGSNGELNSVINLSGGILKHDLSSEGVVNIFGDEFQLSGVVSVDIAGNALTGTLADGT